MKKEEEELIKGVSIYWMLVILVGTISYINLNFKGLVFGIMILTMGYIFGRWKQLRKSIIENLKRDEETNKIIEMYRSKKWKTFAQ